MKMDYEGVERCCQELEACLARIKDIHDDCEAQAKKIKGGSYWAGPASEGFAEKIQKIINKCRNMEKALQNIISYIRICKVNYMKVDDSVKSALNKFKF